MGADWYASIGTDKSKGTKIFSLVGKVVNTGLVEVPMGTSLRTIIYDIGGGIPKRKSLRPFRPAALQADAFLNSILISGSILMN